MAASSSPPASDRGESAAATVGPNDDVLLTQLMETGRIPLSGLYVSRLLRLLDTLGIDPSDVLLYGDKAVVMSE